MSERAAIVTGASSGIGLHKKSIDSAIKAGVIRFTPAMTKPLNGEGIKPVALAPGFVHTPMSEFAREKVAPEQMVGIEDVPEAVRSQLRLSPNRVVPEIVFQRATGSL